MVEDSGEARAVEDSALEVGATELDDPKGEVELLTVLSVRAGRDPWDVVAEGAATGREICVQVPGIEGQYEHRSTDGGRSPTSPVQRVHGLYRVRPLDLAHLLRSPDGVETRVVYDLTTPSFDAAIFDPDEEEGWFLSTPLPLTLPILLVRGGSIAPSVTKPMRSDANRRRDAVLGALVRILATQNKYQQGSPPTPNLAEIIKAVGPLFGNASGLADRTIRGHLDDGLTALAAIAGDDD